MQATVHGVAKSQTWLSDFTFTLALALGSALDLLLSPVTELVVTVCCIQFTFHCTSQSDREMVHCCCVEWEDDTSKWFFLTCGQSWSTYLLSFFIFPVCFKCQTTVEWSTLQFFINFSSGCYRISFDDGSQLSLLTPDDWPLRSSFSRLLSPLQNILNHHFPVRPLANFWAKCVADVANCLCGFMTHFELKKSARIYFLTLVP